MLFWHIEIIAADEVCLPHLEVIKVITSRVRWVIEFRTWVAKLSFISICTKKLIGFKIISVILQNTTISLKPITSFFFEKIKLILIPWVQNSTTHLTLITPKIFFWKKKSLKLLPALWTGWFDPVSCLMLIITLQ